MSTGRSNASARSRRAGGAELNPQQQQQQQQRGQPQQQRGQPQQQQRGQPQQQVPKLSVSDAIGLLSLRLGKVEGLVQNIQVEQVSQGDSGMGFNENSRIIDDNVFKSIVSRLDVLEKNQKALMDNQTTLSNSMKTIASKTSQPGVSGGTQTIVKDVSGEKLASVNENMEILRGEITLVKDLLMKLQNFTMETNQKLVDLIIEQDNMADNYVVHNNAMFFEDGDATTNLEVLDEEIDEIDMVDDSELNNEFTTLDMSEILKNELSSIDIVGEISQEL